MVFERNRQETLPNLSSVLFGTRQQGLPLIVMSLMLTGEFNHMLSRFTITDITPELSGPQLTSS